MVLIDYFLSCNYSLVLYYLFIITYFIVALIFITTGNYWHKSVSFCWWGYRWRVLFRKHEIIVVLVVLVFSIVDMVVSIVGSVVAIIVIGINWVLSRTVVRNVPILAICMVMEKKLCRYISQIIRYLYFKYNNQSPIPYTIKQTKYNKCKNKKSINYVMFKISKEKSEYRNWMERKSGINKLWWI